MMTQKMLLEKLLKNYNIRDFYEKIEKLNGVKVHFTKCYPLKSIERKVF